MTLPAGWSNHLLATHSSVHKALETIRRLAVDGASLGGLGGQSLTPLPEDEWSRMRSQVDEIETQMNALVDEMAHEEAAAERQRKPVSVTRYQLLLALTMLDEEEIDDIDPARGSRYGELDPQDYARLVEATAAIRQTIATIRTELSSDT